MAMCTLTPLCTCLRGQRAVSVWTDAQSEEWANWALLRCSGRWPFSWAWSLRRLSLLLLYIWCVYRMCVYSSVWPTLVLTWSRFSLSWANAYTRRASSLSFQRVPCVSLPLCCTITAITAMHYYAWLYVGSGYWNSGIMLLRKAFDPFNHFPRIWGVSLLND